MRVTAVHRPESVVDKRVQAYQEPERIASLSLVSTAARLVNTVVRVLTGNSIFPIDSV